MTYISELEPDLAKRTNVGLVSGLQVAPIQVIAIRGGTFFNAVAAQTKSSLAVAIVNRAEPGQLSLASSVIALTEFAGFV